MKSIKFLAALAVSAMMITACAKEDLSAVQDAQMSNEIVGAELLGSDISFNFGVDSQTKMTDNGGWDTTDQLGLGWIISGEHNSDQYKDLDPESDQLYANHLFQKGTDGNFTTKGNVYKGWHFVYYPYVYMEKPVDQLSFPVNPDQTKIATQGVGKDFHESNVYLTARAFLAKHKDPEVTNLNDNNELVNVTYEPVKAFNTILINVKPTVDFTAADALKDIKIEKVELSLNTGAFYTGNIKLCPGELAPMAYDEEGEYDSETTKANLLESLRTAISAGSYTKTASTTIDNKDINLGGDQMLRINTLPISSKGVTLDIANTAVKIKVYVEGGSYFEIPYTTTSKAHPELTQVEKDNNKAFETLKEAYAKNGKMTAHNGAIGLNITLTKDLFHPIFNIEDIDDWNAAVAISDALNLDLKNYPFTLKGDVVVTDEKTLAFPANTKGMYVVSNNGAICIGATNYDMPATLVAALDENDVVKVNEGATLTISNDLELTASIKNNGTINAGKAIIESVDNGNGRINVVYGSLVKLSGENNGVIAYTVKDGDTAFDINKLTNNESQKGYAYVNTLVVNDGISFDLSMVSTISSDNDPYLPSDKKETGLLRMNSTNFELNGGTIKATPFSGVKVANVEVVGGTSNKMVNVNVNGTLKVSAGKLTVDAKEVSGYKESVKVGSIDNKAQIVVNTDVYTVKISNPSGAKTTVKGEKTVWYTNNYVQGGTASGKVLKLDNYDGAFDSVVLNGITTDSESNVKILLKAIEDAKPGSTIYVPKGEYDFGTPSGGKTHIYKSITLIGENGTVLYADKGLRLHGTSNGRENTVESWFNIINITVESRTDDQAIYAWGGSYINLVNVICKTTKNAKNAIIFDTYSDGTIAGKEGVSATINAFNVTIPAKTSIEFLAANGQYNYFNYVGGNITDNVFVVKKDYPSTGANYFVNGVALPKAK